MSRSVEELFRDAPEGTTHWDASDSRVNSFMKLEGDMWFYWPPASLDPSWNEWGKSGNQDVRCMIKRPQPKPWSGPEDGLPPVNTVCELRCIGGGWGKAEIKYISPTICVWLWVRENSQIEQAEYSQASYNMEFRAIKTPEQLAIDKRETAIRELMDIAQVDCRVTAARLVDAGFKREVV